MKHCPKCKICKKLSDFYLLKNSKYSCYCKECGRKHIKEYRLNNPEKYRQSNRDYFSNLSDEEKKRRRDIQRFGGKRSDVMKKFGYKCNRCQMTNEDHLLKWNKNLVVHHIDKNGRKFINQKSLQNNDISNLELLCMPCHGKHHQYDHLSTTTFEQRSERSRKNALIQWKKYRENKLLNNTIH